VKKVLIAIGGGVILIVGAILIVPSFIDWSGYRTQISQQVKDFTGRDLLIGGDIAFSVLPSPVLKVSDIRLANAPGASTSNMVAIRQLDVDVALFPLLVGTVHVNSIRLIEPVIQLEMLANGQGNWVLTSTEDKEKNIETKMRVGDPLFENNGPKDSAALPLQIDDFIIERGTLVYQDTLNGTYEEVGDINSRFSIAGLNGPFEAIGTVRLRDIPVGFEANVGQIVNGRTASFATEIRFAHGESSARFSGTFVNLTEGPAIKGKLNASGKSFAGLVSAFVQQDTLPGGLNQPFTLEGDTAYGVEGMSFGEDGLSLTLGRDRGTVKLEYSQKGKKNLQASAAFNKLDADVWLTAAPYKATAPKALPLVISPTKTLLSSGGERASAALAVDDSAKKVKQDSSTNTTSAKLPKDIAASISLSVDAITFKGESIRQVQSIVSLNEGEVSLERLSAILPGAGEFSLVGIAGERDGKIQFDGSMDLNFSHLRGALSWLGMDVSKVPTDRLQHLSVASQVTANPETVRIYDLVAKMDGSSLKGATTIALRARPSFGASLSLDRFNADAYLVEAQIAPSSSGQKAPTGDGATNATAQSSSPNAVSVLDGLKVLNSFDANLDLSAGHLVFQKQDIKNAEFKASIYNGDVKIQKVSVGNFAGLKLGASGALVNKDGSLMAQDLKVNVSGENLADAAKILGQDQVMDWRKLGAVSLSAMLNNNLLAPDLDLSANLLGATLIVAGNADLFPVPKADATVNAQVSDLARLTRGLGLAYQPSGNPGTIEVNTDVSYTPQLVSLKNISGKVGNTALSGEASFKPMARPYAELTLETGALRLDPFLPREVEAAAVNDNRAASTEAGATVSSKASSTSGKWSQDVIDLSGLRDIDAKVRIKSAALSNKKMTAQNVVLSADLKNGVLDISQADAGVFGGQVNVTSQLDASKVAQVTADVRAEGLQVSQILTQTESASSAVGRVDFTSKISAQGQSQAQLVSNLDGTANMTMQGLTMQSKGKGGSVLDILNFLAVLSGSNNKAQADVSVASDIVKGIASLKTANLTSNIATGSATGNVDLPRWTVDVSGNLNIQQNALVGLLAQKAKMKQNYPFSVIGSLDAPNVKLDTGGISSGGGLVIPLPDKLEKKGYGNLIRGLLGAGGVKTDAPATSEETAPAPSAPQDGTMAPPPPPPGGSTSTTTPQKAPSVEEQLLKGLGSLLKR
jgi:uncharacterized protein involved in outer membrane biogenesis